MPAKTEDWASITTRSRQKRCALAFRPWSALQTHFQGVDRAKLTVVIKPPNTQPSLLMLYE